MNLVNFYTLFSVYERLKLNKFLAIRLILVKCFLLFVSDVDCYTVIS